MNCYFKRENLRKPKEYSSGNWKDSKRAILKKILRQAFLKKKIDNLVWFICLSKFIEFCLKNKNIFPDEHFGIQTTRNIFFFIFFLLLIDSYWVGPLMSTKEDPRLILMFFKSPRRSMEMELFLCKF